MPLVNLSASSCFSVIIEEHDTTNDKHVTKEMLRELLGTWIDLEFYAFILHDKDVKKDLVVNDFTPKRKHWHVALLFNKNLAKSTILSNFKKSLLINVNCIGVMPVKPLDFSEIGIRYLTHESEGAIKDNKPIYDRVNVFTNDIDKYYLMNKENVNPFISDIGYYLLIIRKCGCMTDVIKLIGPHRYKIDKCVIDVLFKENHGRRKVYDKSTGEVINVS